MGSKQEEEKVVKLHSVMRIPESLRQRLVRVSARIFGTPNVGAYIKMAMIERLERDEAWAGAPPAHR